MKDALIQKVYSFLSEIHNKFPYMGFKFGKGEVINTFIVEVTPLSDYENNKEYGLAEISFINEFTSDTGMEIMFVSEKSINHINGTPIFEINPNPINPKNQTPVI